LQDYKDIMPLDSIPSGKIYGLTSFDGFYAWFASILIASLILIIKTIIGFYKYTFKANKGHKRVIF
jgi:hypothetical protein